MRYVTGQHSSEERVRSKGQATLLPDGHAEFPAAIRDISVSGLGVIALNPLNPGTFVRIDIHGHAAQGVVQACQREQDQFYIGIALDQSITEPPVA